MTTCTPKRFGVLFYMSTSRPSTKQLKFIEDLTERQKGYRDAWATIASFKNSSKSAMQKRATSKDASDTIAWLLSRGEK